jgi:hypothetical protein
MDVSLVTIQENMDMMIANSSEMGAICSLRFLMSYPKSVCFTKFPSIIGHQQPCVYKS